MRKLVTAAFVSLDGVMQAPGGPQEDPTGGFAYGGWIASHADEPTGRFVGETFEQPFDLVLGRKTYEIFAAYWPFMPAENPIARKFNPARKYVATSSAEPLTWQNSERLEGDVAVAVRQLKQGDGSDLLTQGSSMLLRTLFEHDLIDELRLMVFPIVLGRGKRLFDQTAHPGAFRLLRSSVSTTGALLSVYTRAGDVKTGTFPSPPPSGLELARRERMRREG